MYDREGTNPIITGFPDNDMRGRNMMKKFFLLILLLLLPLTAGCGSPTRHPTKSRSEWGKDQLACERIVKDMYRNPERRYDDVHQMKMIRRCMNKKGWE